MGRLAESWKPEEEARLYRSWLGGKRLCDLAREMGCNVKRMYRLKAVQDWERRRGEMRERRYAIAEEAQEAFVRSEVAQLEEMEGLVSAGVKGAPVKSLEGALTARVHSSRRKAELKQYEESNPQIVIQFANVVGATDTEIQEVEARMRRANA